MMHIQKNVISLLKNEINKNSCQTGIQDNVTAIYDLTFHFIVEFSLYSSINSYRALGGDFLLYGKIEKKICSHRPRQANVLKS